jgi:hypothetical protein
LRLGREVTRAAIEDRDLAERWLDRADNGFVAHVTSPWRWQSHLLSLWEEGDEDLVGRSWEELVLDALRGALDDLDGELGPDQEAWRWGRVHPLVFGHPLGEANPLLAWIFNRRLEVGGGQETVAQVGWDPNDPFTRRSGRPLAGGRRPREPGAPAAGLTDTGHPASLALRRPAGGLARGRTQPMAGEGPWRTLTPLSRWRRSRSVTGARPALRLTIEPPSRDHLTGGATRAARVGAGRRRSFDRRARLAALDAARHVPRDTGIWIYTTRSPRR